MVKFVRTISFSVDANSTTQVVKFVGKETETFKLIKINFDASGNAEMVITKNNTELLRVSKSLKPSIDHGINVDYELEPGDELTVEIVDKSGASNSGTVYYEYEKTPRA